jgi:hypothetical protein
VAVVGAGWAGLAAAVRAVELGHRVTLLEAARVAGGRARGLPLALPGGGSLLADNGQHILLGAYSATLDLMRRLGVDSARALRRLPLALRYPDGSGLVLPRLPRPLDALAGGLTARGWRWADRLALLRAAVGWRRGSPMDEAATVADWCAALPPRVVRDVLEPLCVAALNTPPREASARVFLRVLREALFGPPGSADVLLPSASLDALLPAPALRWLQAHGADVWLGWRARTLDWRAPHWLLDGEAFDQVVLATSAPAAARLLDACPAALQGGGDDSPRAHLPPRGGGGEGEGRSKRYFALESSAAAPAPRPFPARGEGGISPSPACGGGLGWGVAAAPLATAAGPHPCLPPAGEGVKQPAPPSDHQLASALRGWREAAAALRHEAIATVYALAEGREWERQQRAAPWPGPMLALRADGGAPAQFVFDRGVPPGLPDGRLLAFVVSAARMDGAALRRAVANQARVQWGLEVRLLRCVTEKRATFACTPGLRRPPMLIAPGLLACGDYVDGPYPATLEGAVRSGLRAARALG